MPHQVDPTPSVLLNQDQTLRRENATSLYFPRAVATMAALVAAVSFLLVGSPAAQATVGVRASTSDAASAQASPRVSNVAHATRLVHADAIRSTTRTSARTSGYANLSFDALRRPYFNFGIPRSVFDASNRTRDGMIGACGAFLGERLGLKWYLWWAPGPVCGWAFDQLGFRAYTNVSGLCGQVPLYNPRASRFWKC